MGALDGFRTEIDRIDDELLRLLGHRFEVCRQVAKVKRERGIPMMQPARVEQVVARARQLAGGHRLDGELAEQLYRLIIEASCRLETDIIEQAAD